MPISPVILFVYNRPAHTLKTLEALKNNALSEETTLYIYADGAKENSDTKTTQNIQKVRQIIRQKKWCGTINIIESDGNKGLAKSIIEGVSEIVEQHGRAIILEDDIVTSPFFLTYMNEALNFYEKEEKVMHISGYMYPIKTALPETFFYNNTSCWGWATWQRAWQHLNTNAEDLLAHLNQKNAIHHFNINGSYDFTSHLKDNLDGKLNTWAIFWYASVYLRGGLCLHPHRSLVQNIGFDGTGEHCNFNPTYHIPELVKDIRIQQIPLETSEQARSAMVDFYNHAANPSIYTRIYRKLQRFIMQARP